MRQYAHIDINQMPYAIMVLYTDRFPYKIVEKISDTTLEVSLIPCSLHPDWRPVFIAGGFVGHCINLHDQRWIFHPPARERFRIRLHRNGKWYDKDHNMYYLAKEPVRFEDYNF